MTRLLSGFFLFSLGWGALSVAIGALSVAIGALSVAIGALGVAIGAQAAPAVLSAPLEELPQPSINVSPDIYYPLDETLYIEGAARPKSTLQIRFQKPQVKPLNFTVKSDAQGEWVFASKVALEAGDWEVRARLVLAAGRSSEWSNPRLIRAVMNGIVLGGVAVKFSVLILAFLAVLAAGGLFALYFFSRMKKAVRERDLAAAEAVLERNFTGLRRNIVSELEHLEQKLRTTGKLSVEEEEHRASLLRELRNAEEEISDRLKRL